MNTCTHVLLKTTRAGALRTFMRMFGGKYSACRTQLSSILRMTIKVGFFSFKRSWPFTLQDLFVCFKTEGKFKFLYFWVESAWKTKSHSAVQSLHHYKVFVFYYISADSPFLCQAWLAPQWARRSSTTPGWRSPRRSSSPWWPALASPTPRRSTRVCLRTWCADSRISLRGWRTGCSKFDWSDFTFVWYTNQSLPLLYLQNIWEK